MGGKIEIEIPDQSDVVPPNILKGKTKEVNILINSLPRCSSNYVPLNYSIRAPMPHEELREKNHTPYSLFQLFIPFSLLQTMAFHTNKKAGLERSGYSKWQREWYDTSDAEIGAFIGILLYMGIGKLPRMREYWNVDFNRPFNSLIINAMSRIR